MSGMRTTPGWPAAIRWQLWLRVFGLLSIAQGIATVIGGNWFGHSPSNDWRSSGVAPNRVATFGVGWSGQIHKGRPPGGDYVTRAVKP